MRARHSNTEAQKGQNAEFMFPSDDDKDEHIYTYSEFKRKFLLKSQGLAIFRKNI